MTAGHGEKLALRPGAVRARRRQLRLTQAELAEASGVDKGTLSAMENGRNKPRIATRRKVAAVLWPDGPGGGS